MRARAEHHLCSTTCKLSELRVCRGCLRYRQGTHGPSGAISTMLQAPVRPPPCPLQTPTIFRIQPARVRERARKSKIVLESSIAMLSSERHARRRARPSSVAARAGVCRRESMFTDRKQSSQWEVDSSGTLGLMQV